MRLDKTDIIDLFHKNPKRFDEFSIQNGEFLLDFSKNRIDKKALNNLVELAENCHLGAWMDKMKAGHNINHTERRSVFHIALRAPEGEVLETEGRNVVPEVHAELDKM